MDILPKYLIPQDFEFKKCRQKGFQFATKPGGGGFFAILLNLIIENIEYTCVRKTSQILFSHLHPYLNSAPEVEHLLSILRTKKEKLEILQELNNENLIAQLYLISKSIFQKNAIETEDFFYLSEKFNCRMLIIDESDKEIEVNNYKFSCPASINLKIANLGSEKVFLILLKEKQKHICCKGRNLDGNDEKLFEIAQRMVKLTVKYKDFKDIKGIINEFSTELDWRKMSVLMEVAEEENKKKVEKIKTVISEVSKVSSGSGKNSSNNQESPYKSSNPFSEISESPAVSKQASNNFKNFYENEDFTYEKSNPAEDRIVNLGGCVEPDKIVKEERKSNLKLMLAKRKSAHRNSIIKHLPSYKIPPFIPKIKDLNIEKPAFKAKPNVYPIMKKTTGEFIPHGQDIKPLVVPINPELIARSITMPASNPQNVPDSKPFPDQNPSENAKVPENPVEVKTKPILLNDSEKQLKIATYMQSLNSYEKPNDPPHIKSSNNPVKDQESVGKSESESSSNEMAPSQEKTPLISDFKPLESTDKESFVQSVNMPPPPLLTYQNESVLYNYSQTFPKENSEEEKKIKFDSEFINPDLPPPPNEMKPEEDIYPNNVYLDSYFSSATFESAKIEPSKVPFEDKEEKVVDLPRIPSLKPLSNDDNKSIAFNENLPNHLKLREDKKDEEDLIKMDFVPPKIEVKFPPKLPDNPPSPKNNSPSKIQPQNPPELFPNRDSNIIIPEAVLQPKEVKKEEILSPIVEASQSSNRSITLSQVLTDKDVNRLGNSNNKSDFLPRNSAPYKPSGMHPDLPPWPGTEHLNIQVKQPIFFSEIPPNYQAVHTKQVPNIIKPNDSHNFPKTNTNNTRFIPGSNDPDSSDSSDSDSSSSKILIPQEKMNPPAIPSFKGIPSNIGPGEILYDYKNPTYNEDMCKQCLEEAVDSPVALNCKCINCLTCLQESFLKNGCIKCGKYLQPTDIEMLRNYFPDY